MLVLPITHFTWQVVRTVKRAKKPPTGRALRLVPSRRTKDGTFLNEMVELGLLNRVTGTAAAPFEGYIAQIAWLPAQDAGIVILSNTRGSRAAKILPAWLDYQLGLEKTDWFRLSEITQAANTPVIASGD